MFGALNIDPNRVAVYIRWSTEEQGNGTTLDVQRDACLHFAKSQGWNFREDLVFVDDGYSGANLNRPALTTLRAAVQEGKISAVVVYKLDRLSRNLMDCTNLVRQEWAKIALFSTMERFDTHSSIGQMVFNILVSFAEFERNVIRERTMSGKRKRREQGRNPGMRYPYGYRKGEDGGFEIEPAQAQVVRSMFADYLGGLGLHGIADRLNKEGIPAPNGGKWRECSVRMILGNLAYVGHLIGGIYSYEGGKQKRGKEPTFLKRNALPAIVSQGDFDRVQALRKEKYETKAFPARNSDYMLSTIMRCANCGGPMSGQNGSDGRRYYRCANQKSLKNCDCGVIPKEEIETAVLDAVRGYLSPENLHEYFGRVEAHRRQEIQNRRIVVEQLGARLVEIRRKRDKLDADYFNGDMDARQHSRLVERLEADAKTIEEQLEAARTASEHAEKSSVDMQRVLDLIAKLEELATDDPVAIRNVLRQLIGSLLVYRAKGRGRNVSNPIELTIEHNVKFLTPA